VTRVTRSGHPAPAQATRLTTARLRMKAHPPTLIRKREFLDLVHISPSYLDLLIARGVVPSVRLGRCVLIPRDEVLEKLGHLQPRKEAEGE
jgi:hypothetical protein